MSLFSKQVPDEGPTDFFYRTLVPKDPYDNVIFRRWCVEKGMENIEYGNELWMMCARDPLFFLATFGWLLEPRDKAPWQPSRCFGGIREIPFIPRYYQEGAVRQCLKSWGQRDILFFKSREMGATWLVLYLVDWSWRFETQAHYGLVSKDEKSVDNPEDPDSLMSKLDFIHEHLPPFLKPARSRNTTKHTCKNLVTKSTVSGYACTADVGRGGRKRLFVMDEMHAWPAEADYAAHDSTTHVTHCRLMISTPVRDRGQNGAFYDAVLDDKTDMERINLNWKDDAEKSAGLYRSEQNQVIVIDDQFQYPKNYKFILDGKVRSPYYDWECNRPLSTPQSIAAELDQDFGGATNRYFDLKVIFEMRSKQRPPTHRAALMKHQLTSEWLPMLRIDEFGDIDLWLDHGCGAHVMDGMVEFDNWEKFVTGWDIAQGLEGLNSSQSACCILSHRTGRQIAEWRGNHIPVHELPRFAVPLCYVFNAASICPEATGIGGIFINFLLKMGYSNLWFRPVAEDAINGSRNSMKVGYFNIDGGKTIFTQMQSAIKLGKLVIFSRNVVTECERYHLDERGKLVHPVMGKGRTNVPEKSHGDCAIAAAVAWYSMHTDPNEVVEVDESDIPDECWLARRMEFERGHEKKRSYWSGGVKPRNFRSYLEN